MAVYEIYSHPVVQRYKTSICTKATFFFIFAFLLTVLPPLFIAYRSEGFWLKESIYREQPDVNFKHQILLVLESQTSSSYVAWSTYHNFNSLEQEHLRVPTIKSYEEDENRDGRYDRLIMNIQVPLLDTEDIHSVSLILIFDYKLYRFSSLVMESMAYLRHSSPLAGSQLTMDGELALKQAYPLAHSGVDNRYDLPVIDSSSIFAYAYQFSTIFSNYLNRNVSTTFLSNYPIWTSGRGASQPFVIQATIRYPEQTILYYPGFWQLIKNAWIQYLAILIIFVFLFERVKTFVFENQVVNTIVNKPFLKPHQY